MIRLPDPPAQSGFIADLTPLLDVIFIILVFFLLTAQSPLLQVPLQLPDSSDASIMATRESSRRQLALRIDGSWQLDDQPYTDWQALRSAAPLQSSDALDIAVEQGAQADDLLRLLAWLTAQGNTDTRLLMESDDE